MNIGASLQQAREDKGLTLEHLSRVTRISLPILRAIEQNDSGAIPPRPYGRGFVRAYAREVGLDPDQLAREFFAQFAPPPAQPAEPPKPVAARFPRIEAVEPSQRAVFLTVAVMLATIVAVALFVREPQPGGTPQTVGTTGRIQSSAAPNPGMKPAALRSGVTISLQATGPSWVSARADGRRVLYRTLQAGEREVLRAEREITIRVGDAGALRWQIDGNEAAPMGRPGEVRTIRITPQNRPR